MNVDRSERGFTLIEVLVSLAVFSVALVALSGILIENSKTNAAEQARAQAQSNARTALALVSNRLRQAGWNPSGATMTGLAFDSDLTDAINYIDIFRDLNADGDTGDTGESIRIRHNGDRIEWRETSTAAYEIVAVGISNDASGDGTPEMMFTPDSTVTPTRVTVTITAASAVRDPYTDEPITFTLSSEVYLRNAG